MAACNKRSKTVRQNYSPDQKLVVQTQHPEAYYDEKPSWNFNTCDKMRWAFTKDAVGDLFWQEILPHLQALESQKWQDILLTAKKQNHSIVMDELNKVARDRLDELKIEAESIISLRLTGTHRLYGYMVGSVFNILWFDQNHGDNKDCVCRSYLKHT